MSQLKKWKHKGFDFSCLDDEGRPLLPTDQKIILYPFRTPYTRVNINYANSGVGVRERISIVDNAISKCSKV